MYRSQKCTGTQCDVWAFGSNLLRILHLIKLLLLHNHDYFERPQFQTVLQQFCESSALQDTNNFSLIQLQMNTETLTKDWKRRNTLETEPFVCPSSLGFRRFEF